MANIKQIDWDKIHGDYVLGTDYPSFDELAKRYGISKPLLIAKANDIDDPLNRGRTWLEQRKDYIEKKQSLQEDIAVNEAKKAVKNYVKIINNMGIKAFQLINRELDRLDKKQREAIDVGESYPIGKFVKISDITKIAEVLHKLSGADNAREMLVKLELADKKSESDNIKLQDLTDEEIEDIDRQVKHGGAIMIDTENEKNGSG
jgi:hypothetical protein